MWPFKKKTKQRRIEVRRGIRPEGESLLRRFRRAGGPGSVLLAGLFCFCAVLMDVLPIDPFPYRLGQHIPSDIQARVAFETRSEDLLQKAIEHVERATPATFRLDEELLAEITTVLAKLPGRLADKTLDTVDEATRVQFGLMTAQQFETWQSYAQGPLADDHAKQIDDLRQRLVKLHIVTPADIARQKDRAARQAWFLSPNRRELSVLAKLIGSEQHDVIGRRLEGVTRGFDRLVRENVRTYLLGAFTRNRALYAYDKDSTQKDIAEAIQAQRALPPIELYLPGKVLVRRSRRQAGDSELVVTLRNQDVELLRAEHEAFRRHERERYPWRLWGRVLGRAGALMLATALLCIYIARYQKRIVKNHLRGLALVGVLVLMLVLTKLMVTTLAWNRYTAILPVLMTAVIVTIAYDQRFALAMGAAVTVLIISQLRADLGMLVVLLGGLATAVFLLREIRTRSKLIEVCALSAGVVAALVWGDALSRAVPWRIALIDSLWGAGFALLAGFLAQGVLPLIERAFRIATSMTLLEWCDASKPLLKRLATEAPGTYNHSLQLGTMCETAAEAIGAWGLRARVGAYFHDIGKINKPEYFVENQDAGESKHDKLTPAMSLLIIIGHVKDGVEMAREYGLPRVLHEFIATHHGTTLVQYFYYEAARRRRLEEEPDPEETDFRYGGPKPGSKEAAILMLADVAESSVRAMTDPTATRIRTQVHEVVSQRLTTGQLDECDLTLREVHVIETSLIKSLTGIHHSRVAYPTNGEVHSSPAPMEPAQG